MRVNKTKFERNRSLAIKYYQLTCIGKKIQAKEVYWFYEQNNSSARASRFFDISLMFTARLQGETFQCDVLWRTWTYDDRFSFLSLNMDKALHLTNWAVRSKRDKVWEEAHFHFSVMFSLPSSSLLLEVTRPSYFMGVLSYFDALWHPHLFFDLKSNI